MSVPKKGEPKGMTWGRPGPRNPETDYGLQFGSDGGMTRTGSQATGAPQSPDSATSQKRKDLPPITNTIAYNSTMQKLSSLPGNTHMMVLGPDKPTPWAEINDYTYLIVLTRGDTVGVMQMSAQEAMIAADNVRDLLGLATNMGLPKTPDRSIDKAADVHATIVGGKETDPLILCNTLKEYIGVSKITRLAGDTVAVTPDGKPALVTDVPEDQLTPPLANITTPSSVMASGRRYQRGI